MSLDGSSYNTIINNFFSGLDHGGIYLYSNCGEEGSPRRGRPTHNTIINNVFYYDEYDGNNPSIFVPSRNGSSDYCKGVYFDEAKFNVVMQNQIFKLPVSDVILRHPITGMVIGVRRGMIRVGHPEVNTPNYINYNETVTAEIERKVGCYISNGYQKDFIRDGSSSTSSATPMVNRSARAIA
jgi:parallel beta-helix repeat protein